MNKPSPTKQHLSVLPVIRDGPDQVDQLCACGRRHGPGWLAKDIEDVTCGSCKRTPLFARRAMKARGA